MKEENEQAIEDFLRILKQYIETGYNLDKFGNIVLKNRKSEIIEKCNNMIDEFARNSKEEPEEVRNQILEILAKCKKTTDGHLFEKENNLVFELLTEKNNFGETETDIKENALEK